MPGCDELGDRGRKPLYEGGAAGEQIRLSIERRCRIGQDADVLNIRRRGQTWGADVVRTYLETKGYTRRTLRVRTRVELREVQLDNASTAGGPGTIDHSAP